MTEKALFELFFYFLNIISGNPKGHRVAFLFLLQRKAHNNFFMQNCEKYSKKLQKTLDKNENYVIILKCVIILFFFGGFLPFFQELYVIFTNLLSKKCAICPNEAKNRYMRPELVKF